MSENVKPESLGERVAREFFPYDDETQRIDFGGIEAVRERLAEVVDRLSAPAAPGIREAAEAIALCVRTTRFGNPRDPRDKEDMIREFERILLSRLGASGKEDEATLLRSPEGHVVARLASGKAGWTKALAPFVRFIEAWDAKPLSSIDDEFYAIHTGTEWAASLRLSDFRALRRLAPKEE